MAVKSSIGPNVWGEFKPPTNLALWESGEFVPVSVAESLEAERDALKGEIERLCTTLDYAWIYLPSEDEAVNLGEEFRSVMAAGSLAALLSRS